MAEAVGLVLSTVTLASLFQTCLEFIEYFHLSKSYEKDYERASLKLNLLHSRLDTCGRALSITIDCRQIHEASRQSPEGAIIYESLQGIADIFRDAELLRDKYSLSPCQKQKSNGVLTRHLQVGTAAVGAQSRHIRGQRRPSFFRRSTTWAIRDKQKFDVFLADLDFFISNLEVISLRTRPAQIPSAKMNEEKKPAKQSRSSKSIAATSSVADKPSKSRDHTDDQVLVTMQSASTSQRTMYYRESARRSTNETSKISADDSQIKSATSEIAGYKFKIEEIDGNAKSFQGMVGQVRLEPAPEDQICSFTIGKVTDEARASQGGISGREWREFLN